MSLNFVRPVHPGEYLRDEFLVPLGLSAGALAKKLNLPRTRIERLIREEVALTPDTALRLARYFRTTPQFWLNFQQSFDLETQMEKLKQELETISPRSDKTIAA